MQPMDRLTARLFVKPGMVVYDIGTFDGATAAGFFELGASRVIGFEPLAKNRARISDRLMSDPRFRLFPVALSDTSGAGALRVPDYNPGAGSLSAEFVDRVMAIHGVQGAVDHPVDVTTLDALDLPPADFWKIDVEGAELAMLRGAEETLRRSPPRVLQIEIFRHSRSRFFETLEHIKTRFRHVWVLGIAPNGKMIHYPVTAQNLRRRRFYEDVAAAGTPHYFASMQSFWDLIRA